MGERYIFAQRVLYDNRKHLVCFDGFNLDEFMGIITNLLNHQNNKIKELELLIKAKDKMKTQSIKDVEKLKYENQQLKQQLSDEENAHDLCIDHFNEECEKLRKQIKFESEARGRFKQFQNSKAIEVLEKAKKFVNENAGNSDELTFANRICERFIDKEITELRGEENE